MLLQGVDAILSGGNQLIVSSEKLVWESIGEPQLQPLDLLHNSWLLLERIVSPVVADAADAVVVDGGKALGGEQLADLLGSVEVH